MSDNTRSLHSYTYDTTSNPSMSGQNQQSQSSQSQSQQHRSDPASTSSSMSMSIPTLSSYGYNPTPGQYATSAYYNISHQHLNTHSPSSPDSIQSPQHPSIPTISPPYVGTNSRPTSSDSSMGMNHLNVGSPSSNNVSGVPGSRSVGSAMQCLGGREVVGLGLTGLTSLSFGTYPFPLLPFPKPFKKHILIRYDFVLFVVFLHFGQKGLPHLTSTNMLRKGILLWSMDGEKETSRNLRSQEGDMGHFRTHTHTYQQHSKAMFPESAGYGTTSSGLAGSGGNINSEESRGGHYSYDNESGGGGEVYGQNVFSIGQEHGYPYQQQYAQQSMQSMHHGHGHSHTHASHPHSHSHSHSHTYASSSHSHSHGHPSPTRTRPPISPITGLPTKIQKKRSFPPKDLERRKYVCGEHGCGYSFCRPSALETHKRTHTGERPYGCPVPGCLKQFTVFSNLKRHMLIHKGIDFRLVTVKDYPYLQFNAQSNQITMSHLGTGGTSSGVTVLGNVDPLSGGGMLTSGHTMSANSRANQMGMFGSEFNGERGNRTWESDELRYEENEE